jgi:hypothetical protein
VPSESDLQDKSSPQYQAAKWVADEDHLALPIGNPQLVQRYILIVFYFSTKGDEWLHCSRTDPICGGDPDEDSWLSDASECFWLANRCTNGVNVDRIFFGIDTICIHVVISVWKLIFSSVQAKWPSDPRLESFSAPFLRQCHKCSSSKTYG